MCSVAMKFDQSNHGSPGILSENFRTKESSSFSGILLSLDSTTLPVSLEPWHPPVGSNTLLGERRVDSWSVNQKRMVQAAQKWRL